MDETFERILIDYDGRQSVFSMGKLGILWELDRTTGEFVSAVDLGYQNILDVDARTGEVAYRDGMVVGRRRRALLLPEHRGLQGPSGDGVSPRDRGLVCPAQPEL